MACKTSPLPIPYGFNSLPATISANYYLKHLKLTKSLVIFLTSVSRK